jgi:hypothetical protein
VDDLKGKKVYSVKEHKHLYNQHVTRVEINFDDGTMLTVSVRGNGVHTETHKGDPPKEKILPWVQNEKAMISKLSKDNKEKYKEVKKAFFWIIENRGKVEDFYTFTDRVWVKHGLDGKRRQFTIQIDMDENDPNDVLTIFMSSHVAPECDNWFRLGLPRDWDRILETYNTVKNGES